MSSADLFGTIQLSEDKWLITCEPHVRGRLRRIFPQVSQRAGEAIWLTDNEENSRDLLWFTQRYPMAISPALRKRLKARSEGHIEAQSRVIELLNSRRPPDDFELARPAREYQRTAGTLLEIKTGLLLADDVGLGKTVSSICAMARAGNLPVLVVTLTHLPEQWLAEINNFAPELQVHILKSGQPYDLIPKIKSRVNQQTALFEDVAPPRLPDVIISNYHKLHGWAETLAGLVRYVVFDECQELRHQDSNKYHAAKHIAAKARLRMGLSATPIYNMGAEFYSVINILLPEALGTYEEFYREWCTGEGQIKEPKVFGSYLRREGIMLRRTRKDVGRELPPCSRIIQNVCTDQSVMNTIKGSAIELAKIILASQQSYQGQKFRASEEFNVMLRQATGIAKCVDPHTQILKFDGSVVEAHTLRVGDVLMGPDSRPRRILVTTSGRDEMFEVTSTSQRPLFKPYVVNGNHILALKHSGKVRHGDRLLYAPYEKGQHVEIRVRDYLTKSAHFKRLLKGFKSAAIEFEHQSVPVDPYFLGLWLGDGSSDEVAVTSMDDEIREYLYRFAAENGLDVCVKHPLRTAPTYRLARARSERCPGDEWRNPVRAGLSACNVLGNKHIPRNYLVNDRKTRLALLAGLLDADGHFHDGNGYTIKTKWRHLADEICWLAQSLGFRASSRQIESRCQTGCFESHSVSIGGSALDELPVLLPRKTAKARRQIKDPLRSGIDIRPLGVGDYFGFELDGDGLFLLEDFTVTHNSPYVAEFVRLLMTSEQKVILFGWHRDVYSIWMEQLAEFNPMLYTGTESPKQKAAAKEAFVNGDCRILVISLRSGAGLDGLQSVCNIGVFGELDWSPGVHEQNVGRFWRDGQDEPSLAYFLLSEDGSDPVIADILGLKKGQIDGVRDPDANLVESLAVEPGSIKRLAQAYLDHLGVALPPKGDAQENLKQELALAR